MSYLAVCVASIERAAAASAPVANARGALICCDSRSVFFDARNYTLSFPACFHFSSVFSDRALRISTTLNNTHSSCVWHVSIYFARAKRPGHFAFGGKPQVSPPRKLRSDARPHARSRGGVAATTISQIGTPVALVAGKECNLPSERQLPREQKNSRKKRSSSISRTATATCRTFTFSKRTIAVDRRVSHLNY